MKEINVSNTDKDKNINNQSKSKNYHALSKLDLKVLLREINESFDSFLRKNNLNNKAKIFLSGRNSQHKNLVELIGENLKIIFKDYIRGQIKFENKEDLITQMDKDLKKVSEEN